MNESLHERTGTDSSGHGRGNDYDALRQVSYRQQCMYFLFAVRSFFFLSVLNNLISFELLL